MLGAADSSVERADVVLAELVPILSQVEGAESSGALAARIVLVIAADSLGEIFVDAEVLAFGETILAAVAPALRYACYLQVPSRGEQLAGRAHNSGGGNYDHQCRFKNLHKFFNNLRTFFP